MMMKLKTLGHGVMSAALILSGAALCSTESAAKEIMVHIDNFAFVPATVDASVGDTIVWENADDIPHSVVSAQAGIIKSKVMDTGERFSFAVREAGSMDYFCGLHPHMKGKIIIQN
jgi:plastocyanin